METKLGSNHRRHVRTNKSCVARFRFHEGFLKDCKWEMVCPRNLSASGIQFLIDKDVKVGELMDFVINIPGADNQIKCGAMVVRVDRKTDNLLGSVAACFIDIDYKDMETIDKIAAIG